MLFCINKIGSCYNLCELFVVEQFKNSIPQHVVTYVSEQKAITVLKAAELADDFVLTHKEGFEGDVRRQCNVHHNAGFVAQFLTARPLRSSQSPRVEDDSKVCYYCQNPGN